jgi:hypothetical protein
MIHEFDDNVALPTSTVRQGSNIEMLKQMKIGQSKWWPLDDMKKATRFYRVAKKLGLGIAVRKVDDTDARGEGVRLFRIDKEEDPIAAAAREAAAAVQPKAVKKVAKLPVKKMPMKKVPVVKKSAPKRKVKGNAEIPSTPAYTKKQLAAAAKAAAEAAK